MLRLASRTHEGWIARALAGLDEVLIDHAHLEKKAASTALTLIFRYPDRPELALPLSALAREELEHFERVVTVLRTRGLELRRQRPSPYPGKLFKIVRPREPVRLLDTLLCSAFIEARSCERMQLLAEHVPDPALSSLYGDLFVSEAQHHRLYVDLARSIAGSTEVVERLQEIALHEAAVLAEGSREPRLHS